jgi:hypothetical protein
MKYLALNNAGVSLHFADGLFASDSIDPEGVFPDIGFPLVSMSEPPFTNLDLYHTHHATVVAIMHKAKQQA